VDVRFNGGGNLSERLIADLSAKSPGKSYDRDGNVLGIVPDSRWLEIPGAGHVVYLESPDLFFGSLRRFFEAKSTDFEPLEGVEG
jgi:pimeloyl-ACP methyl ester carboxylesterase